MLNKDDFASMTLLLRGKAIYKVPQRFQNEFLLLGNKDDQLFSLESPFPQREEEKELLSKIIGGVNKVILEPENRKLSEINLLPVSFNFQSLIEEYTIKWAVSFGEASTLANITLWNEHYSIYENEGVKWIKSHSLQKLIHNQEKKAALWKTLNQLFSS